MRRRGRSLAPSTRPIARPSSAASSLHLQLEKHLRVYGALALHLAGFVEHHRLLLAQRIGAEIEGLKLGQGKYVVNPRIHIAEMNDVVDLDLQFVDLRSVFF